MSIYKSIRQKKKTGIFKLVLLCMTGRLYSICYELWQLGFYACIKIICLQCPKTSQQLHSFPSRTHLITSHFSLFYNIHSSCLLLKSGKTIYNSLIWSGKSIYFCNKKVRKSQEMKKMKRVSTLPRTSGNKSRVQLTSSTSSSNSNDTNTSSATSSTAPVVPTLRTIKPVDRLGEWVVG